MNFQRFVQMRYYLRKIIIDNYLKFKLLKMISFLTCQLDEFVTIICDCVILQNFSKLLRRKPTMTNREKKCERHPFLQTSSDLYL